jgi:electron transfer flavoprotein alpha subunit
MSKLNSALVVATRQNSAGALVAGARTLADRVTVVYAGPDSQADGADQGIRVPQGEDAPFLAAVPAIARLAADEKPEVILAEASADGRLAAAAAAAALGTSVIADASEVAVDAGRLVAKRRVYGGAAVDTVAATSVAVVTVSPGLFEAADGAPCGDIRDLAGDPPAGVKFLGRSPKAASGEDLSSAKTVVGVGRGVGSAEGLAAVRRLAAAIGAGVGATRPAAEETDWYGGTRYIGISGDTIRPDVYIACGVSGQVQHLVGVSGAGLIFAVNKDAKATIFGECDYGIVGDLDQVIPELTARFEGTPA